MSAHQAKGRALTRLAALYGVRRRWFGLEFDRVLRRRVMAVLKGRP